MGILFMFKTNSLKFIKKHFVKISNTQTIF